MVTRRFLIHDKFFTSQSRLFVIKVSEEEVRGDATAEGVALQKFCDNELEEGETFTGDILAAVEVIEIQDQEMVEINPPCQRWSFFRQDHT